MGSHFLSLYASGPTEEMRIAKLQKPHPEKAMDFPAPPPFDAKINFSGLKLLIVDDDADSRDFYRYCLEEHGIEVVEAADLAAASLLLDRYKPDLIISDFLLADGTCLPLISQAKELQSEAGRSVGVIILSGLVQDETRMLAREAGCDQYLFKPVEPDQLIRAVARLAQTAPIPRPGG
uniref:Response regulator receiver protein n=1 Tax=Cyanothece sp. (strain PCC 7425 / ATCC 29141) TaxID=395961 RepID=B8HJX3_CYAP4